MQSARNRGVQAACRRVAQVDISKWPQPAQLGLDPGRVAIIERAVASSLDDALDGAVEGVDDLPDHAP